MTDNLSFTIHNSQLNNWVETTLGEICEIIDGDRGSNYPNGDDFSSDGYCLFLNTKNVPDYQFSFNEKMFITKEKDEILRKGKLQRGDFVLTTRGTVGNYAFYSEKIEFENIRINSGMVILRTNQDKGFFNFYLKSPLFKHQIISLQSGTAQPQLPIKDLKTFEILLPPLPEQQAIASVLSAFDDKIELLREQNKTLEEMGQTLFNYEFRMVNGELGGKKLQKADPKIHNSQFIIHNYLLPEGWRVGKLSEIAEFLNGIALQKFPPENEHEYLPVVKIRELKAGITAQTDKASKNIDSKYIVDDGDILFSWSGSLEIVIWKYGKGALNQHLFKVSSQKYPKWFYYLWTLYHLEDFRSIASNKATTMGHIQRHHLDQAQVIIPDDETLQELDQQISPILEKIMLINQEIQSLARSRDELLPKLMSGLVRVNDFSNN